MKTQKGFTMVELIIAISILGMILMAVSAIFSVSIKTYQVESQRGFFQKELNFVTDSIARDIKQSQLVQSYSPYSLGNDTLILRLPSIDNSENFIYSGGIPLTDTVVYYRSGDILYKVFYANPASKRYQGSSQGVPTKMIKENVAAVNFSYSPNINAARSITFSITESATVGKKNVTLTGTSTANLRNKP